MMRKSLYAAALACTAAALPLNQALAVDADVTGLASFRVVITLNASAALDFAPNEDVEYSGAPDTSELRVSTSGVRTETGSFYTILNATGQAGVVDITGTSGEMVDIACDASSVAQKTGGKKIDITAIEIDTTLGGVGYGLGTACTGVSNNVATLLLDGTDHVLVGGTIVANSQDGVEAGDYSTALATDPIKVRVVYQ